MIPANRQTWSYVDYEEAAQRIEAIIREAFDLNDAVEHIQDILDE